MVRLWAGDRSHGEVMVWGQEWKGEIEQFFDYLLYLVACLLPLTCKQENKTPPRATG